MDELQKEIKAEIWYMMGNKCQIEFNVLVSYIVMKLYRTKEQGRALGRKSRKNNKIIQNG